MCRLPDKAGAGSKSMAANGFPDSNQRSAVGQQLEGVWGERGGCKMTEVPLLTVDELCIHPQQAKDIKGTFNSTFLFRLKL